MTTSLSRSGVAASLCASALFGAIFVLPPLLRPLDPLQVYAYRMAVVVCLLAVLFSALRAWGDVVAVLRRCRRRPRLAAVIVGNAALIGVQMWLFGWAPQTGHGLEVSLGYLLLPVAMVVVGVAVYREKLSPTRVAAVLCASVGAAAAVVLAGGLGWPTLVVALGLPLYFMSRRAFALDTLGAQMLEMIAMLPVVAVILATRPSLDVVLGNPELIGALLLLGALSAAGFTLYLTASRLLPFSAFGVLSYVEPVLLVLVALTVLGEPWTLADVATYAPICLSLTLLALDARRDRTPHRDPVAVG